MRCSSLCSWVEPVARGPPLSCCPPRGGCPTQGAEYLGKEKARLEKMLGTGSVAESKVEEMSKKTSVLSAFVDEE